MLVCYAVRVGRSYSPCLDCGALTGSHTAIRCWSCTVVHRRAKALDPVAHFWSKVKKNTEVTSPHVTTPCWVWTGSTSHGYGRFYCAPPGIGRLAHRYAWFLTHGSLPPDLDICHHCDNRLCVRSDHLFKGTAKDNLQDASRKGRTAFGRRNGTRTCPGRVSRGERHWSKARPELVACGVAKPNALLDPIKVVEIRRLHEVDGVGPAIIGRMFGVHHVTIMDVLRRQTWKHVA
jgi:hypothetical protein